MEIILMNNYCCIELEDCIYEGIISRFYFNIDKTIYKFIINGKTNYINDGCGIMDKDINYAFIYYCPFCGKKL